MSLVRRALDRSDFFGYTLHRYTITSTNSATSHLLFRSQIRSGFYRLRAHQEPREPFAFRAQVARATSSQNTLLQFLRAQFPQFFTFKHYHSYVAPTSPRWVRQGNCRVATTLHPEVPGGLLPNPEALFGHVEVLGFVLVRVRQRLRCARAIRPRFTYDPLVLRVREASARPVERLVVGKPGDHAECVAFGVVSVDAYSLGHSVA